MTREYSVARETFWIEATAQDVGEDDFVETGTDPNLKVRPDVRVVIHAGVHYRAAVDLLKGIVVGLIEEGYLLGYDPANPDT